MRHRQLPRLWLMTDERQGDALFAAIARLPRGGGIVFRHHATPPAARCALFVRVRRVARAGGLVLVLADTARTAAAWRADGVHGRTAQRVARPLLRTAPAHDAREAQAARRAGASLVFVSPFFPTRSHPGARTLRRVRGTALARAAGIPAVALGGMTARRARGLVGFEGWAAIDAWGVPDGSNRPSC